MFLRYCSLDARQCAKLTAISRSLKATSSLSTESMLRSPLGTGSARRAAAIAARCVRCQARAAPDSCRLKDICNRRFEQGGWYCRKLLYRLRGFDQRQTGACVDPVCCASRAVSVSYAPGAINCPAHPSFAEIVRVGSSSGRLLVPAQPLPEYVVQDAAVTVIVDFLPRVEPARHIKFMQCL